MLGTLWDQFLQSVDAEKQENPVIYSVLKQLQPTELTEEKIVLSCENQGFKFFLQKKLPTIESYFSRFLNKKIKVELIVKPITKKTAPPLLSFEPTIDDVYKKAGLNSSYTFENFAVSTTNQVAYAATSAACDRLGKAYNPLFLYGGVGVGKTHLAHAMGCLTLEKDPAKKVFFCPGDFFTNELIEAIREKSTARFRRKYRKLDLLIIDDVQFIAGKNAVQEEFFHTFNAVVSSGGQVVLTSDKSPLEIRNLEDRLRSRFSGGLTVDIQSPDFELRTAILLIKAKEKVIDIDIEAAKIVAQEVTDSRALEGTLLFLYANALGRKNKIDLEEVDLYFRNKKKNSLKKITSSDIISAVCSSFHVKPSHIKGRERHDAIALPRQVAMYLLRRELRMKYEEIAFILKRKDHTTIMHGVEKIGGLMAKDPVFKSEVDRVINSLFVSTPHSH